MNILNGTMARLPGCSRRQLLWRSLLAASSGAGLA